LKQGNKNGGNIKFEGNISINSSIIINEDPLLFLKLDKLLQTGKGFEIGECEEMM